LASSQTRRHSLDEDDANEKTKEGDKEDEEGANFVDRGVEE
jgi:hypothetical protein